MRFIDEKRKNLFRAYVAQAASVLEIAIAVLVLAAILITGVRAAGEVFGLVFAENSSQAFTTVLEHAFNLIIGVEFIKMLAKHTPGSAIEVLLFAIARQMVIEHTTPVENLVGIVTIALIFIIRKYLFVPSFGTHVPGTEAVLEAMEEKTAAASKAYGGQAGVPDAACAQPYGPQAETAPGPVPEEEGTTDTPA